jgi:hypothetical protein
VKKQQAAAKKLTAKVKCWGVALKKGKAVDPACLAKAEQKFDDAFAKAEEKGGCLTSNDAAAVETLVDGWLGELLAALPARKVVFISSQTYDGNLGGLAGADAKCQTLATTAGLAGTYVAWLSDSTTDAASRIGPGAYALVDGTIVATGLPDLLDGTLVAPINLTESGAPLNDRAWTGTAPDGTACFMGHTGACGLTSPGNDGLERSACANWTVAMAGSEAVTGVATTDGTWTLEGDRACPDQHHLYCIQQ